MEAMAALKRSCHSGVKDMGCIMWRSIPPVYLYFCNSSMALKEFGCEIMMIHEEPAEHEGWMIVPTKQDSEAFVRSEKCFNEEGIRKFGLFQGWKCY